MILWLEAWGDKTAPIPIQNLSIKNNKNNVIDTSVVVGFPHPYKNP
jgi:hypothetical protein